MTNFLKYIVAMLSVIVIIGISKNYLNTILLAQFTLVAALLSMGILFWENNNLKARAQQLEIFLIEIKNTNTNLLLRYLFAFTLIGLVIYNCWSLESPDKFINDLFEPKIFPPWEIHPLFYLSMLTAGIYFLFHPLEAKYVCFEFKNGHLKIAHPTKGAFSLDFTEETYEISMYEDTITFAPQNSNKIIVFDKLQLPADQQEAFSRWTAT